MNVQWNVRAIPEDCFHPWKRLSRSHKRFEMFCWMAKTSCFPLKSCIRRVLNIAAYTPLPEFKQKSHWSLLLKSLTTFQYTRVTQYSKAVSNNAWKSRVNLNAKANKTQLLTRTVKTDIRAAQCWRFVHRLLCVSLTLLRLDIATCVTSYLGFHSFRLCPTRSDRLLCRLGIECLQEITSITNWTQWRMSDSN